MTPSNDLLYQDITHNLHFPNMYVGTHRQPFGQTSPQYLGARFLKMMAVAWGSSKQTFSSAIRWAVHGKLTRMAWSDAWDTGDQFA